ncbi:ArnT family glycosyltransferase [Roseobacter litoralis]|uniref:ArnT family glycosyltransferase n=1 Tax=Roseobacter litoralis TaxID=42443 RepID=UPI002493D0E1|nr:hypothetical protein [Roseobacter litoralis]
MSDVAMPSNPYRLPLIATFFLIIWVMGFHVSMLGLGAISHYDEFLTLDRSTSFAAQNDWWNTYTAHEVNFNKPPLQYWISGWLIEQGVDLTIALRAPSFMFGGLTLIGAGLFAFALFPKVPWTVPVTVLFVASSDRFWEAATMALLDVGSLFFLTMTFATIHLALRAPLWWYAVALSIGLGALQKAPIAFGFAMIYLVSLGLTGRWHGHRFRTFISNRHFLASLALALVLVSSWHLLQFIQHGSTALQQAVGREIVGRLAPSSASGQVRDLREVLSHMFGAEGAVRLFGLIAAFWLPFRLRRYDLLPIPLVMLFYAVGISFSDGFISHRYTLLFTTMTAVMLAGAILAFSWSMQARILTILLVSLFSGGPTKPPSELELMRESYVAKQIEVLSSVAKTLDTERRLFVCNWHKKERFSPGNISYYGSSGQIFMQIRDVHDLPSVFRSGTTSSALEGLCRSEDLAILRPFITDLQILSRDDPYVHFYASVRELSD